jgi:capsule polysaccharide export protein KpsE/RkpR
MELFESVILMGLGLSIGYFTGTLFYRRRLKKTLMAMRNFVAKDGVLTLEHHQAALSLNGVSLAEPLKELDASFDVLSDPDIESREIEALEAEQESLLDAVTA